MDSIPRVRCASGNVYVLSVTKKLHTFAFLLYCYKLQIGLCVKFIAFIYQKSKRITKISKWVTLSMKSHPMVSQRISGPVKVDKMLFL